MSNPILSANPGGLVLSSGEQGPVRKSCVSSVQRPSWAGSAALLGQTGPLEPKAGKGTLLKKLTQFQ